MTPESTRPLEILVSISDIVDLVGATGPAVVTNWRARFSTFPEPRVHGTQPRFELEEVLDWLRHDGPRNRSVPEPEPIWMWQRLVEAFGAAHSPSEARTRVTALLAVRHLLAGEGAWRRIGETADGEAGLRLAVGQAAQAAAEWSEILASKLVESFDVDSSTAAHLVQLAAALDEVLAGSNLAPADRLTDVLAAVLDVESNERRLSPHRTRPVLARMMVSMAAVDGTDTVFDPAAGEGDVLDECIRRTEGRAVLHGQEYDAGATFIATVRSLLRGVRPRLAVPGHDSLRDDQFEGEQFSVVVLDPPSGRDHPPRVWIKHAVDHLRPDGRLVMMLPLSELAHVAAARRRPDLKLRAYLSSLFGGATSGSLRLDGVVVMPRGLRTDITGPVALLAMSGPERLAHTREVPVAWIGLRTSVDSVVDVLDDAMRAHGARALLEVQLPDIQMPDVIVRRSDPGQLWETLEQLVEVAGRESTDGRRSSPRRVLSDEMAYEFADDSAERAEAVQRLAGRVSDNSVQALLSDSLTARRALRATAFRAEAPRSERPRDVFAFNAIDRVVNRDDVLPEQDDRSFVELVDTTGVTSAAAELSRLLADARRGAVTMDAAVQRRVEEVTSMLEAAIDALERGRSKR